MDTPKVIIAVVVVITIMAIIGYYLYTNFTLPRAATSLGVKNGSYIDDSIGNIFFIQNNKKRHITNWPVLNSFKPPNAPIIKIPTSVANSIANGPDVNESTVHTD